MYLYFFIVRYLMVYDVCLLYELYYVSLKIFVTSFKNKD